MKPALQERPENRLRARMHEIIFESDTKAGRAFDVCLLWTILLSVAVTMLESVPHFHAEYGALLRGLEWSFTALFTLEFALRLVAVRRPWMYATSFFGLVDLLAIAPTYVSAFVPGAQSLLVIRVLRLLRVFRIFKLGGFLSEADLLLRALRSSRQKIVVFVGGVLGVVVVVGALMYLIEGPQHGFDSIPRGMYWAIVTMTTVGFGDITPKTVLGQALASALMILGYGVIAVPTGIVSAELAQAARKSDTVSAQACPNCGIEGHDPDAVFCKRCGAKL